MGADLTIQKSGDYFRDSYNSWNCLWGLNLSWWRDVSDKLVSERTGNMSVANTKKLLKLIEERMKTADDNKHFETLAAEEWGPQKTSRKEMIKHWKKHRRELIRFLKKAIELKSPIKCSL